MQAVHSPLKIVTNDEGQNIDRVRDGPIYVRLLGLGWLVQDVIDDLVSMTGVAYTQSEPHEILVTAEGCDDIAKAVMSTMPAATLQTGDTRWQIDLIMDNQYVLRPQTIISDHRGDGPAAAIHEGLRFKQSTGLPIDLGIATKTVKASLFAESSM